MAARLHTRVEKGLIVYRETLTLLIKLGEHETCTCWLPLKVPCLHWLWKLAEYLNGFKSV